MNWGLRSDAKVDPMPRTRAADGIVPEPEDSGFRVQGSGFRVQGSGFRVQGSEFRAQGSGFRVRRVDSYGLTD